MNMPGFSHGSRKALYDGFDARDFCVEQKAASGNAQGLSVLQVRRDWPFRAGLPAAHAGGARCNAACS